MDLNQKTILLVDDDADMLAMEERWLAKSGYCVISAASGREALDNLKVLKPDMIILDFCMPNLNGEETLAAIRNFDDTKNIPVFFLTGMEEIDKEALSKKLNPQGYLSKSLGKKAIVSAVNDFFGN